MKKQMNLAAAGIVLLAMAFGCGEPPASGMPGSIGFGDLSTVAGDVLLAVDIDHAAIELDLGPKPNKTTNVDGHLVYVYNGPAGCAWNAGTSALTCEIVIKNGDADECMAHVRARLYNSTNPSAIMTGADYVWPGPTIVPNSAQPINESGYCITQASPSAAGSAEGCANTWQDYIPPNAIASQNFVFTNVPVGQYTAHLQIMATYQACSAPPGMALIPAGCFNMGDAFSESEFNERPAHNVCITSDFSMDDHEVTNAEYAACVVDGGCLPPLDSNSFYTTPPYANYPIVSVSWNQATAFCAWEGKRLPTEAEWEYAARGGLSDKRYPWGNAINGSNANYLNSGDPWDNSPSQVKYYSANGYMLYDMVGNVWEWVNDYFGSVYYGASPINDPPGPATGSIRVFRGGSCHDNGAILRQADRGANNPATWFTSSLGFRCARD